MRKIKVLFFLTVVSMQLVWAQEDSTYTFDKYHYWATIGWGKSTPVFNQINFGASYLANNRKVLQADYYVLAINRNLRGNSLSELQSLVVSYGVNSSLSRRSSLIFATGLSFGKGTYVGADTATDMLHVPFLYRIPKYIQTPYQYIGLCLNAQYLMRMKNYGLGIKMYFNIHQHPDLGLSFTGNFGYLNKKWQPK